MEEFIRKLTQLQQFIENDAPDIIGLEAVSHFKKSFQDEGFSDKSEKDMPWQEVKRRQNSKLTGKAAGKSKILTGESKELGESLRHETRGKEIAIISDKIYAEVHNKGLETGRKGRRFTMPKRQFVGKSMVLNNRIKKKLIQKFKTILK